LSVLNTRGVAVLEPAAPVRGFDADAPCVGFAPVCAELFAAGAAPAPACPELFAAPAALAFELEPAAGAPLCCPEVTSGANKPPKTKAINPDRLIALNSINFTPSNFVIEAVYILLARFRRLPPYISRVAAKATLTPSCSPALLQTAVG